VEDASSTKQSRTQPFTKSAGSAHFARLPFRVHLCGTNNTCPSAMIATTEDTVWCARSVEATLKGATSKVLFMSTASAVPSAIVRSVVASIVRLKENATAVLHACLTTSHQGLPLLLPLWLRLLPNLRQCLNLLVSSTSTREAWLLTCMFSAKSEADHHCESGRQQSRLRGVLERSHANREDLGFGWSLPQGLLPMRTMR
jgi:hypothetical protein